MVQWEACGSVSVPHMAVSTHMYHSLPNTITCNTAHYTGPVSENLEGKGAGSEGRGANRGPNSSL